MSLAHPALSQEHEIAFSEMDSLLPSCHSIDDVENVAEHFVPRFFPGWSGALLLVDGFGRPSADVYVAPGRDSLHASGLLGVAPREDSRDADVRTGSALLARASGSAGDTFLRATAGR